MSATDFPMIPSEDLFMSWQVAEANVAPFLVHEDPVDSDFAIGPIFRKPVYFLGSNDDWVSTFLDYFDEYIEPQTHTKAVLDSREEFLECAMGYTGDGFITSDGLGFAVAFPKNLYTKGATLTFRKEGLEQLKSMALPYAVYLAIGYFNNSLDANVETRSGSGWVRVSYWKVSLKCSTTSTGNWDLIASTPKGTYKIATIKVSR